ncbi:MAG TPA: signal peptidase II [Patescibacteria group bacterium]|jgi:signal peptidase II|nr:signal peptidase II [Patescibacteria group bacterium]
MWLIFGCLLFLIDRLTKSAALYYCSVADYHVTSFLSCTYLLNQGTSLNIFMPDNEFYFWLLTGIICIGTFFFSICWLNVKSMITYASLGFYLITVGSLSNIIDRFLYTGVIDWIYAYYGDHHFPVFNCADAYIVLGTLLVFYAYIKE